jgi:hypothetical protein
MRIALVGTSPSSRLLAPYNDASWQIWGVGPGNMQPESRLPRCDVFFEIHPYQPIKREPSYKPYLGELAKIPKVFLQKEEADLPNSVAYPLDKMLDKYGPYFFTSSFSYMIAQAIEELTASEDEEKVLGLWGIDCSATEEYRLQRPGAQFFFMKAREAGINVVCPPESDLLHPPGLYGYVENDPWFAKQIARQKEYQQAHGEWMTKAREAQEMLMRLAGNLDDIQWNLNTWGQRPVTRSN